MLKLKELKIVESKKELEALPEGKLLINTINAHSYNTALKDDFFAEALMKGDALIPDGASIVMACRKLKAKSQPKERIAGWDLFTMEMERLNRKGGTCFFMGSSEKVLKLIREKGKTVYPNIRIETYSPPYKPEFSEAENREIIEAINRANPDLLWIGMTAPKQKKWAYRHWTNCTSIVTAVPSERYSISLQASWNGLRCGGRNIVWNGCTDSSRNPNGCGAAISSATRCSSAT